MVAKLSKNALSILEKRYLKRDTSGNLIETPDELFRRVAKAVAAAEREYVGLYDKNTKEYANSHPDKICKEWEDKFYEMMVDLEFLPNSPTMFNSGKDTGTLSGCFFFNVGDSMVEIMDVATKASLVQKHGGGVGYALSDLRAKGALIKSTHGKACGPIAVMKTYHAVDDMITQGGKRAGAQMAVLSCDHPDIEEFITCKEDDNTLTTFNISVAATDEFMKSVCEDNVKHQKKVMLFEKIVEHAWKNGDPGLLFIDTVNKDNPTPWLGPLKGCNPCSELPLLDNESCNLGSINLGKFVLNVTDIDTKQPRAIIGWEHLKDITELAVRFLDDVIDVNKFPVEVIKEATLKTRKIGLGVMGWADMLVKLGIPYNSDEAVKLAEEVMGNINKWALNASMKLADERGSYPALLSLDDRSKKGKYFTRNATRTTIAPTGSLSLIAGCSSGIEPIYALVHKRSNMSGALEGLELEEAYPPFVDFMASSTSQLNDRVIMGKITDGIKLQDVVECPPIVKNLFVTALDIPYTWHIKMQAAFQKHVDNAISKTINMPNSATIEDVRNAYILAWKMGCKGVTVYRDGSREKQVLSTVKESKKESVKDDVTKGVRPRLKKMSGDTTRVNTGCGWVYITVNRDKLGIREVFVTLGKTGGCASAYLESIGRLVSLALKNNVDVHSVVRQLRYIRCPAMSRDGEQKILSCSDAIAIVLLEETGETQDSNGSDNQTLPKYEAPVINTAGMCPECGNVLVSEEGCLKCRECGYSRC
jgi:ribonucleoside-diphosphate reductase alpha chain